MDLMESIFELIGAIANAAVANGGTKLKLYELAKILTLLDIESHGNDHYKRNPSDLIRKAYEHFIVKNDQSTADNIKATYIKSDGTTVVP
jgi:hypothetical protein